MNPLSWLHLGVLAIAGLLCNQNSHAGLRYAPSRDAAVGNAIWDAAVAGRTTTIGGTGGGMTVIGPAAAAVRGSTPGSALVVGGASAAVAGSLVPVSLSGEIVKDVIIGAIVGCATGGQIGCVLGAATPVAQAYISGAMPGSRVNPDTGSVQKGDGLCRVAPCTGWKYSSQYPARSSPTLACRDADFAIPPGESFVRAIVFSGQSYQCMSAAPGGAESRYVNVNPVSVDPVSSSPTWYPVTSQELKDALYKNDPPAEIVDELGKHGNIVWTLGDPTRPGGAIVTGPSSITGPSTTTVNPDGSRSVSSSSTPLSYSGSSVTAGPTTTTTKTTAADGTATGTTTSTVDPTGANPDAPKADESPPTDTALPDMPKLYTPKYPDGLVGVWRDRKAELTSSSLVQLKDSLLPTISGGGACPAWMLPVNTGWVDFGTYNVAPPCWIWDFGRVIIILSAMFLARALIFGG